MNPSFMAYHSIETPAFVFDLGEIGQTLRALDMVRSKMGVKVLYSLKACANMEVISLIAEEVSGFAVSSLYEARVGREILGGYGTVHLTTPGLRQDDFDFLSEVCDFVSFNSLSQWERFQNRCNSDIRCGLRINPQLSVVRDERYDPCRRHSKLGIPLKKLVATIRSTPLASAGISGLHVHNNCDSSDFEELNRTVAHIEACLDSLLRRLQWINLGGGYLFDEILNPDPFYEAVGRLRSKYELDVFIEPGASVVRKAGYLASTVLDLFDSDGKTVAILDTTVNHVPEVFEYQFQPDVMGHVDDGRFEYILAGCTCLAGDVFGEYAFEEQLEVGSRVVFTNMGAYTTVKWHTFNGVNRPTIYVLTESGDLNLKEQFTYEDFASRCGVNTNAIA